MNEGNKIIKKQKINPEENEINVINEFFYNIINEIEIAKETLEQIANIADSILQHFKTKDYVMDKLCFVSGSFACGTAVKNIHDLDVVIVMNKEVLEDKRIKDIFKKIEDSAAIPDFKFIETQIHSLHYHSDYHKLDLDIVPVFIDELDETMFRIVESSTLQFPPSDIKGKIRNAESCSPYLKNIIKLMKFWNHSNSIITENDGKKMLLKSFTIQSFCINSSIKETGDLGKDILNILSHFKYNYKNIPTKYPDILEDVLKYDYDLAKIAVELEDLNSARNCWSQIFHNHCDDEVFDKSIANIETTKHLMDENGLIERHNIERLLHNFINDNQSNKILFIYGETQVGKTAMISKYFFGRHDYLYLQSSSIPQNLLRIQILRKDLKFFIFDSCSSSDLQNILSNEQQLRYKDNVFIIILKDASASDVNLKEKMRANSFEIPLLHCDEIKLFLNNQKINDNSFICIKDKRFYMNSIIDNQDSGLYKEMQYPGKLKELCKLSKNNTLSNINFDENNSGYQTLESMEYVPLAVSKEVYLYNIQNIADDFNNNFKLVIFEDCNNLSDFLNIQIKNNPKFELLEVESDIIIEKMNDTSRDITSDQQQDQNSTTLMIHDSSNKLIPASIYNDISKKDAILVVLTENLKDIDIRKDTITFTYDETETNSNTAYFRLTTSPQFINGIFSTSFSKSVEEPASDSIIELIEKNQCNIQQMILFAEAGSGKSATLKRIYDIFLKSSNLNDSKATMIWGQQYYHMAYFSFQSLAASKAKTMFEYLRHYFCTNISHIFENALKKDMNDNRILFLIDGWDELTINEKENIKPLLSEIKQYHFIITTRRDDKSSLPFKSTRIGYYQLKKFENKDIHTFISNYFSNNEYKQFRKKLLSLVNKSDIEVIGLPLRCALFCIVFDKYKDTPNEFPNYDSISQTKLYELFVVTYLRRFMSSDMKPCIDDKQDAEICCLCEKYLLVLQKLAFHHIFKGKSVKLSGIPDYGWFSENLFKLGFIKKNRNEFLHKTFAEYLAALFIVNLLLNNKSSAFQVIAKYRYQVHYKLVFQFVAGTVSDDKSIIIPNSIQDCLYEFWNALLQDPRDLFGKAEKSILKTCYLASKENSLTELGLFTSNLRKLLQNDKEMERTDSKSVKSNSIPNSLNSDTIAPVYPTKSLEELIKIIMDIDSSIDDKKESLKKIRESKYDLNNQLNQNFLLCLVNLKSFSKSFSVEVANCLFHIDFPIATFVNEDAFDDFIIKYLMNSELNTYNSQDFRSWLKKIPFCQYDRELRFIVMKTKTFVKGFEIQCAIMLSLMKKSTVHIFKQIYCNEKNDFKLSDFRFAILYGFLCKNNQIVDESYVNDICSIEDLFILSNFLDEDIFIPESYKPSWLQHIFSITSRICKSKTWHYKNKIWKFVTYLSYNNIEYNEMQILLKDFLSEENICAYWDVDAVKPTLAALTPYFDSTLNEYILHKANNATFLHPFYAELDLEILGILLPLDKIKLYVETCIKIFCFDGTDYSNRYCNGYGKYDDGRYNISYCIAKVVSDPKIAFDFIYKYYSNHLNEKINMLKLLFSLCERYSSSFSYAFTPTNDKIIYYTSDIEHSYSNFPPEFMSYLKDKSKIKLLDINMLQRNNQTTDSLDILQYSNQYFNE